jgi:TrmH family RNA methyltransferase
MKQEIISPQNKLIKLVKKIIGDKKYRDITNLFVGEGYRVVNQLIDSKVKLQNILISKNSKYINKFDDVSIIPDNIFTQISSLTNSDGVLGVFVKPKIDFNIQPNKKYIILNKLQNPNNLGSIIRTCVAFNIDGIFITNDSVDLFHPTIIRSSMGTVFNIPIKFSTSLMDVIKSLKQMNYQCYATTINKYAKDINTIDFSSSSAVVFGNEGNGLEEKDIKLCDTQIYIKISPKIDSLNVASTVAIIAHKLNK